jgi:hypothetical protein
MSTNRAPKLPHQEFVFDLHEHKIHEQSRSRRELARRGFLQLAALVPVEMRIKCPNTLNGGKS